MAVQQLRRLSDIAQQGVQSQGQSSAGAATLQLEQAAKGTQPVGPAQIQQTGAAVQQAQQQGFVQAQQQGAAQATELKQQALQVEASQQQITLKEKELNIQTQQRKLQQRIYSMDRKLGNELFRKQVQFKKDQFGRTLWNEQQLSDFKRLNAQNKEELLRYEMQLSQLWEKKKSFLEIAHKKAVDKLQNEFKAESLEADVEAKKSLIALIQKLERDQAKAQADAQNSRMRTQAIFSTLFTVGGAVAGGFLTGGSPAGIMAGGQAGGALGGGIGTLLT